MRFARRVYESYHRQTATGAQRRGSCRHRNTEVRVYDHGLTDILRNELHWLSVPQRGQVQARHHDVSLPASLTSAVPVRLLHTGRECRRS